MSNKLPLIDSEAIVDILNRVALEKDEPTWGDAVEVGYE